MCLIKHNDVNILHICSYYENVLYENLVKALQKKDINNEVYVFLSKETRGTSNINTTDIHVRLSYCYNKFERFFFHLKHMKVLNDFVASYEGRISSFDCLFAHSLFSNGYIAYKAKEMWKIPYVVMVQNTDINVFFKYMKHLKSLAISIIKNADKVIFASETYRQMVLDNYIPDEGKTDFINKAVVVPYGIDDFYYSNMHKNDDNNSKKNNEEIVLTVGTVCRNKNQLLLAKAINLLNNEGHNIRLIAIGDVGERNILEKLLCYSFVEYIDFIPKENLIEYYNKADVFALPSIYETFGLVYAEALSQGCPVLYSKGQGFDKQFVNGDVGYSVISNDFHDIAQKLELILQDKPVKENCIQKSEKFRWKHIARTYIGLFANICTK